MPSIPRGDALALTRALVAIDSRNSSLVPGGPGERAVAERLAAVLAEWGFTVDLLEARPGRPNVLARIGGGVGGRSLMLNGHLDTVGVERMSHEPWTAKERDGRLYGRGSADMKAGIAAMCAAAARAAEGGLGGEVIIAAVIDEEFESHGTRHLLESGVTAHAAIVTEPTRLAIATAHRGFAWVDLTVTGRAAHGSRYDLGVDAITGMAHLLTELDAFHHETLVRRTHPLLGHASLHAGVIAGGTGISTYPDRCTVSLERRTLPGEQGADFVGEVEAAIARVRTRVPAFEASVTRGLTQEPNDVPADHPLVVALQGAVANAGLSPALEGLPCWTDAALLSAAGIPALCFGPGDIALAHAAEEFVPIADVTRATEILTEVIRAWSGPEGVAWGS